MFDAGLTPLEGGHSGETFLGTSGGEKVVVRILAARSAQRGPDAVDIDAAVLCLVRGLLPVPEVLEVRRSDPVADVPGILVTSFLLGERLDLVLADADEALQGRIGVHVGDVLTRLNRMPFLRGGPFVDADLRLGSFGSGAADLRTFVEHVVPGSALEAWAPEDLDRLFALADHAQDLLDPIARRCLVHSDFNPKNLLVDPGTGEVTGVLDWEFAHAGLPVTDLGNLLRFEESPAFVESLLDSVEIDGLPGREDGGAGTSDDGTVNAGTGRMHSARLLELARAADLWALVDLAGRAGENPVAACAHDLLLTLTRTGDLHPA
ncbi:phosphotransferase [Nocardioides sp. Soil796]|uniref:phosphotransferase n=1 Tax=Nocardioides sp. Soil796 TaxID=1736412 RepID=UPI00070ADF67|nr:phosphotransferase [Nocardioides sp. Soil796]KRF19618.1 hypothetical protein ASH02_23965 [Nocardioides sp. Soil796]